MNGPRREDVARIGELTGRRPIRFRRAAGGYTAAERWVVDLEGGAGAFAKIGVDQSTAGWLRQEHRAYAALDGDFMPELLGWDDGERPLLLLEDLSGCFWPPPWDAGKVDRVLEAVARLRAADHRHLSPLDSAASGLAGCWQTVAEEPAEFLSLGLATGRWLRDSAPVLAAAAGRSGDRRPLPHSFGRAQRQSLYPRRGGGAGGLEPRLSRPPGSRPGRMGAESACGGRTGPGRNPAGPGAAGRGDQRLFRKPGGPADHPDGAARARGAAATARHVSALGGACAGTAAARRTGGLSALVRLRDDAEARARGRGQAAFLRFLFGFRKVLLPWLFFGSRDFGGRCFARWHRCRRLGLFFFARFFWRCNFIRFWVYRLSVFSERPFPLWVLPAPVF